MPTENRSSNTEQMVSVPLDLVELALAHLPSDSAAGFELRDLLAQPAAQHYGEPVAVLYADGDVLTKAECGESFETCCKVETPLYLHPPTSDGFSAGDMADQGAKAFAARDGEVQELRELLRKMTTNYARALEAGFDRITFLGGDCDSVEKMLEDNPDYAKAIAALSASKTPNTAA